mmetsp:Transcript_89158/g.147603  ORF Transcript_89158/g.147603 Transcript_89158/m.147603 type:complete len:463 (-) Transcript_89158:91-1479(-)
MSPGVVQASGVEPSCADDTEAERMHAEVVAALHREKPLPFAARRVAEHSDQLDDWPACLACTTESPAASSSVATYSAQVTLHADFATSRTHVPHADVKGAKAQSDMSPSYIEVLSSNVSGDVQEGILRGGVGNLEQPEGDLPLGAALGANRAATVNVKTASSSSSRRTPKGFKTKARCHTACRPRWKLRDVMRNLRRMMPRRRHCLTDAGRRAANAVAVDSTNAGAASSNKDAMPMMPLTSWTEPFWEMRPPSEAGCDEDSGSEAGSAAFGNFEHAGGSATGVGPGSLPLRKSLDTHAAARSCLPEILLPGTGLSCRDCVKPDCLRADFLNHEMPKLTGTKTPKACAGGMLRTASAPELEVFGIERNFEFGGTGWVRTAAEDQPAETVFFPTPPEHAGWRVYHSGHHARRKRLRRIQNRGLPLRSKSLEPNAPDRQWVAPSTGGSALAEAMVPRERQIVYKL